MESKYKPYDFDSSLSRIDEILNSSSSFEEKETIPKRDELTFTNGYYVKSSALFVDIRDSTGLPDKHQKRTLAKLYRSYISEIVAILNGFTECKEINIVGDCVSAIFEGRYIDHINSAFEAAFTVNTIINILNYKLEKKGISTIKAGIGLDWGSVLMVKAGYKGSTINDVVWMGNPVNKAAKLCSHASKTVTSPIVVSSVFYNNLNEHNQGLLSEHYNEDFYHGSVIHTAMYQWLLDQMKAS